MNSKEITEAYADFLSTRGYKMFFTGTTAHELTLKSARRLAYRFGEKLLVLDPDVEVFWVAEAFGQKKGFHLHGLIKINDVYCEGIGYRTVLNAYQKAAGGPSKWNRIDYRKLDGREGAFHYVAKYILKSSKADYDLITNDKQSQTTLKF